MKRILPILFLIAAAACSSSDMQQPAAPPAMKAGGYSADQEPSPVGVIPEAKLTDTKRNKELTLSIEYPTRGGPFPVIIFSHGYGLSDRSYEPLISYWTGNGYVCIRPSHADAGQIHETPPEMIERPNQERRGRNPREAQQQAAEPPAPPSNPAEQIWQKEREPQWQARAADIELVLDSLGTLEQKFPELVGKMDHSKVGVAGHGYGAFTALMVGGMRTFGSPSIEIHDPRITAIEAFSPPGIAMDRGTSAQSWTALHLPVLFMTGSADRGATQAENADWRKESYENSPAGDKYFVLIDGARYASFTGQNSFGFGGYQPPPQTVATDPYGRPISNQQPQQQRPMVFSSSRGVFGTIKITSLAFWDAYLKNETSARDLLQPAKYDEAFSSAHMSAK